MRIGVRAQPHKLLDLNDVSHHALDPQLAKHAPFAGLLELL